MARFEGWRRLSGDTDSPYLLNLGKKLLGFVAEQRSLSGVQTLAKQIRLPDGSIIRASFAGDLPCIEIKANNQAPTPSTRDTWVQGFVAHPRAATTVDTYGEKPDVLLDNNGAPRPDAKVRYINLFFDGDYLPTDPNLPASGFYEKNRFGNKVFPDGLTQHGNVDWRSADEAMVVSWGGSQDRYFGFTGTPKFFGKSVCINGQVVADLEGHPDLDDADAIIGACVRKTGAGAVLIVATAREFTVIEASKLRVYSAPLLPERNADTRWLETPPAVPALGRPLFASIALDAWTLLKLHTFTSNDATGIRNGQPLCFNQSGTEARLLTHYLVNHTTAYPNLTLRELIVDTADLSDVTVNLVTRAESLYADKSGGYTGLQWRLLAQEFNVTDGTFFTSQMWEYLSVSPPEYAVFGVEAEADILLEPQTFWVPAAVDYRDDEPVYAYLRAPSMHTTGSYTASPTITWTPEPATGTHGLGESTIAHDTRIETTLGGLRVPGFGGGADFELILDSLFTQEVSTNSEAQYDQTPWDFVTPPTYSINNAATVESDDLKRKLVLFHLDLRTGLLAYGIHEEQVVTDLALNESFVSVLSKKTIQTGTITTTKRLRALVQIGEEVLADSGLIDLDVELEDTFPDVTVGVVNDRLFPALGLRPVQAWGCGLINESGVIPAGFTNHSTVDAAYALIPIPALNAYAIGTYDLSAVGDYYAHADIAQTSGNQADDFPGGVYGPFSHELMGTGGIMPWAKIPVQPYTGAPNANVAGYWAADRDSNYCYSMAWPVAGAGETWRNHINGLVELDNLTGGHGAQVHAPIWLTTRFAYEHATK